MDRLTDRLIDKMQFDELDGAIDFSASNAFEWLVLFI